MAKRGGFPGGMPGNMNNLMKQAQRMQRQMEEQFGAGGFGAGYGSGRGARTEGSSRQQEGEVKVYRTSETPEKRVSEDVGDYVEFEETKGPRA